MEIKIKIENLEELNAWFDNICTRCAMCNRDCGKADPCTGCRADKIYRTKKAEFERRK